jgi:hypothetical protein
MSVLVVTRPSSDEGVGGWTMFVPGAPATELSDDNSATGVFSAVVGANAETGDIHFGAPALPAGARIESLTWRLLMNQTHPALGIVVVPGDRGGDPAPSWLAQVPAASGAFYTWSSPAVARNPRTGADWDLSSTQWTVLFRDWTNGDPTAMGYGVSVAEAYLDVRYRRISVVNITGPADGSLASTSKPTISWSVVAPDISPAQQGYVLAVWDEDTYTSPGFDPDDVAHYPPVWTSGRVYNSGARLRQIGKALPSGNYRAYVWSFQPWGGTTAPFWSLPAHVNFSVNLPVATPTASGVGIDDDARVDLSIDGTANPATPWVLDAGGLAELSYHAERSADGGATWTDVRRLATDPWFVNVGDQATVVSDREAPFQVPLIYRVRQEMAAVDGSSGLSDPVTFDVAALNPPDWWLADPTDASRRMPVNVAATSLTTTEAQGVYEPLGRAKAVVISDGAKAQRGELTVRARDATEKAAITTLLSGDRPLLLQSVLGDVWFIRVTGDRKWTLLRAQPLEAEASPIRSFHEIVLPWIEVDAP